MSTLSSQPEAVVSFWRAPWVRLVFALVLVLAVASGVTRLKFDNSTEAFFLKSDPTLEYYDAFRDLFASDEYSLITIDAPSTIDAAFIESLDALEQQLAQLENVREVTSLRSVRSIDGSSGLLDVRGYLEAVNPGDIQSRVQAAQEHPYYRDLFISADGEHLGIVVETALHPGEIDYKLALRKAIRETVAASALQSYSPTIVGAPILDAEVRDIVSAESGQFGGLVFVIVALGFYWVFRSLVAVLIPLAVSILSIAVTFGMMGWLGAPITLLTPIIPSFLISVGVGSSIFLLTHYFRHYQQDKAAAKQQAHNSTMGVLKPCVLASVTTVASLFAFSSSDIVPVKDVGIALGIGLSAAFILTFTLGSALLEWLAPVPSQKQAKRLVRRSEWLHRVDRFATQKRHGILAVAVIITLLAAYGLSQLHTDYYYLGTFKEQTTIRSDYAISDDRLPRSAAIEVLLTSPYRDGIKNIELLNRVDALQREIEAFGDLPVKTYSMVDVAKEINQALYDGDPSEYRLPDHTNALTQSLLLFESSGSDEMSNLVSPDYRTARITVQLPTVPESRSSALHQHIDEAMTELVKDSDYSYTLTGLVPMWQKINGYLLDTQIQSVLLAFSVTLLVLIVYSRSIAVGVLLATVNASVVVIVLGIMALMGWALDPYTVLVASIALGVLDDDTLHFFSDIRSALKRGLSFDEAVSEARAGAGQAMYYLAFCLIAGFLVYRLSSVASLSAFGTLVALVIALGLVWEWLVMPAYLAVLHRWGWFKE
jgi:predicted RND superfamily exporter protein